MFICVVNYIDLYKHLQYAIITNFNFELEVNNTQIKYKFWVVSKKYVLVFLALRNMLLSSSLYGILLIIYKQTNKVFTKWVKHTFRVLYRL